jgi:succinate dehydrogenase/fumarate reductase cytochrome b subunit
MQSLVCSSVGAWVCVFGIVIILHHIIISFRTTLHDTSYYIDGTKIKYEAKLRQMLYQNENVMKHEVSFGRYSFIRLAIEGLFLYEA